MFPPPIGGRAHVHMHSHWVFCPVGVFTSVDLHRRVVVRARPAAARVTVYHTAPRFEFVQRVTPRKIVRVAPSRVTVRSSNRSFVRVEVSGHAKRRAAVPVGATYKTVKKAPARSVTVQSQSPSVKVKTVKPSGATIRVESAEPGMKKKATARKKKVTVKKK